MINDPTHNIARVLSKLGYCSRKQAIDLVLAGRVRLNGKTVTDPGTMAAFNADITVDGKTPPLKDNIYLIFYKPAGYITTRSDEKGRDTVYKFFAGLKKWVFPVGQLDKDSEGLLIFTNDTVFGDRLTDPALKIPRTYEVVVEGDVSPEELDAMSKGTDIGRGEISKPSSVRIIAKRKGSASLEITLVKGKNREIRRLLGTYGKTVVKLRRVSFGPFKLGGLKPGERRSFAPPKELMRKEHQ